MKKALFLQLLTIFMLSCQVDNAETVEEGAHLVKVMTRSDCQSNVLLEEEDIIIKFYFIQSQFDFSEKELIETLSPNIEGNYFTDLELGYYYFEVINQAGIETLTGIFSLPDDFDENGNLRLVKGRKRGEVYERLENNEIGELISNATVIYRNEITGEEYITQSDEFGIICIEVNPGRYYVEVTHPDYQSYSTEQGFGVFYLGMDSTNNFFLEQ